MPEPSLLRRNPQYRHLWFAKIGSEVGDCFNQVALAQTTFVLTGSAASMGLVLLCRSLPAVFLGPLLSPWVDRLPKKPILYSSDLLRALFALSFALAFLWRMEWVLYVGSFLLGLSGTLFSPARQAVIPLIVPREELAEANAFSSGSTGVVNVFGAMSGGIVAAAVSPVACFVINALSYLWSAFCIYRARWQEEPSSSETRTSYWQSLREGVAEATHNRVARAIILIGISWGLAGGGYYVLLPLLGEQVYHMAGLGVGLLYSIDGIGVLVGAYLVKRFVGKDHRRAFVWYGAAYLTQAIFFAAMAQFSVFALGALMLLLMRVSSGVIIPLGSYLLQTSAPPNMRGRLFSLHGSTYGGVMQMSYLVAGLMFDRLGIPLVGLIIGGVSLACGLFWLALAKKIGLTTS